MSKRFANQDPENIEMHQECDSDDDAEDRAFEQPLEMCPPGSPPKPPCAPPSSKIADDAKAQAAASTSKSPAVRFPETINEAIESLMSATFSGNGTDEPEHVASEDGPRASKERRWPIRRKQDNATQSLISKKDRANASSRGSAKRDAETLIATAAATEDDDAAADSEDSDAAFTVDFIPIEDPRAKGINTKAATCKILFVGEPGVGKSSLIECHERGKCSRTSMATIGLDNSVEFVKVGETTVCAHFVDTSGQEKYQALLTGIIKDATIIVLVFDIASDVSFQRIGAWTRMLRTYLPKAPLLLVGNKCDLEDRRRIALRQGKDRAEELRGSYFETSAYTGAGVSELFEAISKNLPPVQEMLVATAARKAQERAESKQAEEAEDEAADFLVDDDDTGPPPARFSCWCFPACCSADET